MNPVVNLTCRTVTAIRWLSLSLLVCLLLLLPASGLSGVRAQDRDIDALLDGMTLDQQVGQLFMVSFKGIGVNDTTAAFLRAMQPGAVALFATNGIDPVAVTRTTNTVQMLAMEQPGSVPLLTAIDQEGGPVNRLVRGFTLFPWGGALGAMSLADVTEVGLMTATELRAVGITMNLAPVADIRRDPGVTFMERRSWGYDPVRVGDSVSAYLNGMRTGGVIGALKHFPGHGSAGDSHAYLPLVEDTRAVLNNTDLMPFRTAIKAGADVVMVGHLAVPALEPDTAIPASLSVNVVTKLLREQMGFNGVVMTDALDMGAIVDRFTRPRAAVMTLLAGGDMITTGPNTPMNDQLAMKQAVLDAVSAGELSPARIRESARRILALKQRFSVLDWSPLDMDSAPTRLKLDDHQSALIGIYRRAVAVHRDEFKLLPLSSADNGSPVALVYPGVYPRIGRFCAAFDPRARQLAYALNPSDSEITAAMQLADKARAVVVFTYNMRENPAQIALVNRLPREKVIVVALQNPYDLDTGINPGAYVVGFNTNDAAFDALCGVLYGAYPARGVW